MCLRQSLLRLLLLLVALSSVTGSRLQKESGATIRKRHGHHDKHNNPHRYPGGRFDDEIKPFAEKTVERVERKRIDIEPFQEDHWDGERRQMYYDEDEEEAEDGEYFWKEGIPVPCPSGGCSPDVEMNKLMRIIQIKEQILKETGLDSPPNMTGVVISQSPVLQRLIYNMNLENQDIKPKVGDKRRDVFGDDPNIKKEKVFLAASKGPAWVKIPESRKLHYFNLSREHSSSIAVANLHTWLKPLSNTVPKDNVAQITILKAEPPKFSQGYNRLRSIIDDVTVPYSPNGIWAKVDVFSLVREWLIDINNNLGFVIKVSTVDGIVIDVDTAEDDPSHAPLLELDVKEERNDRRKRFANNRICSDKKVERECCRYPLTVNFLMYKFDFIVAPKKYVANYCMGECPFLYAHKIPHSTLLQQMFPNNISSHGPCCGARDLAPLKMVYYDGHKLKLGIINDMVVNQCSCT